MPRVQSYHLHLPRIGFDGTRQMKLLYVNRVLRDLVNKIAYFFFPIYLFVSGQKFLIPLLQPIIQLNQMQAGMIMIALYYLLFKLVMLIFLIPEGRLSIQLGYQRAMIWSYLIYSLYFAILFLSINRPALILVAALFDAIQGNLFWPIYKTILSKSAHKAKMGSDLGLLQFLLQLVAVISPAIAGLVSLKLGFEVLFLFGLIGTLVGLIVTMLMHLKSDYDKPSWHEFFVWFREKRYRRLALSVTGRYLSDTIIYLWPLYVFLILKNIGKVGFLYTISLFLAMLVSLLAAFVLDKIKNRKAFHLSGGLLSLVWLLRTQVTSIFSIALVDSLDRLISNFHWLFYDMILFRRSKGHKAHSYFVYYEVIIALFGILFWLSFIGIFLIVRQWHLLFVFGSIGVLLSLFLHDKYDASLE